MPLVVHEYPRTVMYQRKDGSISEYHYVQRQSWMVKDKPVKQAKQYGPNGRALYALRNPMSTRESELVETLLLMRIDSDYVDNIDGEQRERTKALLNDDLLRAIGATPTERMRVRKLMARDMRA